MSPLIYHHLSKRLDSGVSFSIIFGIIAVSVVIACAIWGFVVPKWKQKHPPDHSRTKWNDVSILTTRKRQITRTVFPIHPAIKPILSKPSAAQILPTYDPRVESPFPDNPESGISRELAYATPRTYPTPTNANTVSSDGLFTPVKSRSVTKDLAKNNYYTVPRATESKHFTSKSTDFGDAKDFILAVPEPLALRPRDAGRPPAVARHLEKYGTTHSNSPANSDKLLHPNKLFHAIQSAEFRSSFCSSTSMRVDHRESDAAAALAAREVNDALDQAIEEGKSTCLQTQNSRETSKSSSFIGIRDDIFAPHNSLTALHRLRSYRSLTGYQPPEPRRAGTVTRPKTPVNELRRFYNQDQSIADVSISSLPKITTKSTTLTTFENSSDNGSISTPATSPTLPSSRVVYSLEEAPYQNMAIDVNTVAEQEKCAEPLVESADEDPRSDGGEHPETTERISQGFSRPGRRCKPAPPKIHTSVNIHERGDFTYASPVGVATTIGCTLYQSDPNPRPRASSMYSRDTYGYSLAPTPVTPEYLSPMVDIFAEHDIICNPSKSRESVRARISEWTQRIEGNCTPSLPLLKQAASFPQVSTMSTQLANNNVNNSSENKKLDQNVELSANVVTVNNVSPTECREGAPGGANWI